jgi:hypothetical protein
MKDHIPVSGSNNGEADNLSKLSLRIHRPLYWGSISRYDNMFLHNITRLENDFFVAIDSTKRQPISIFPKTIFI